MNTPRQAIERALALVGSCIYQLGTGDCDTKADGKTDCAGFAICMCYDLRRHRPGYNVGPWSTVSDDLNSNSIIEDGQRKRELFATVMPALIDTTLVERMGKYGPSPGDLIAYPTIRIPDAHGSILTFVGHVAIVTDASKWNGAYASLTIAQSIGPNGRTPSIVSSSAKHFDDHDAIWPKPQHRSWLVRAV